MSSQVKLAADTPCRSSTQSIPLALYVPSLEGYINVYARNWASDFAQTPIQTITPPPGTRSVATELEHRTGCGPSIFAEFQAARGETTITAVANLRRLAKAMRRKSARRRREQPVRCSRSVSGKRPTLSESLGKAEPAWGGDPKKPRLFGEGRRVPPLDGKQRRSLPGFARQTPSLQSRPGDSIG